MLIGLKSRSPSWGAWIEIFTFSPILLLPGVAPPRGERGLKYFAGGHKPPHGQRRSPSWGAWIEIVAEGRRQFYFLVAPPRGERGLKYCDILYNVISVCIVAPPRGERGLKYRLPLAFRLCLASLPLVGSVD